MNIDDLFWVIVVVVGFALSGLQKLFENSKKRRQMYEDRMNERRDRVDEAPDRIEDTMRTAKRRGAARPVAQPRPQSVQIEDVMRRLMGEEPVRPIDGPTAGNEESPGEDWRPVPPPPIRRAPPLPQQQRPVPPRQMQPPPPRHQQMQQRPAPPSARPERQRPARSPQELMGQPRRRMAEAESISPEEIEQRENERRWREEMERRKKQQAAQQAQQAKRQAPEVLHTRARLQPSHRRLFQSTNDVRRAIILSEILNPPRAIRDLEERV